MFCESFLEGRWQKLTNLDTHATHKSWNSEGYGLKITFQNHQKSASSVEDGNFGEKRKSSQISLYLLVEIKCWGVQLNSIKHKTSWTTVQNQTKAVTVVWSTTTPILRKQLIIVIITWRVTAVVAQRFFMKHDDLIFYCVALNVTTSFRGKKKFSSKVHHNLLF